MSQNKIPPPERIASSFRQLTAAASDRKLATEELATAISKLDAALNTLNPGVSAWHKIAAHEDQDGSYWSRDIGYTMVGKRWGIALRRASGHNTFEIYNEEVWLFNDAPPWMCVESVSKIPDLFDELIKRTQDTTKKLRARSTEADDLAKAVIAAAAEMEAW